MIEEDNKVYIVSMIENGVTSYIKSYQWKENVHRESSLYVYYTTKLVEAKIWKKRNGAFRAAKDIYDGRFHKSTTGENAVTVNIEDMTNQRLRLAKLKELGFHE